jgi:hypothetical protein
MAELALLHRGCVRDVGMELSSRLLSPDPPGKWASALSGQETACPYRELNAVFYLILSNFID